MSHERGLGSVQAPSAVVMIRPHHFHSNPQTIIDNAFQRGVSDTVEVSTARRAFDEVSDAAKQLESLGIATHVFDDTGSNTPDSVFPNNWFSTHAGGHVAVYPMAAENRRQERRYDVLEMLKAKYRVQDIIDYSGLEQDQISLEGTGAMVLDHVGRVAYVAKSKRADPVVLERFCTHFNYEPMVFDAIDPSGKAIYHTNVMMCVATEFALIGLSTINDKTRQSEITQRLEETGRTVIDLTQEQIAHFAGNAIELQGNRSRVLVLSKTAIDSLLPEQIKTIRKSCQLLALDVSTIEKAGGSIRCMIAGIHLSPR